MPLLFTEKIHRSARALRDIVIVDPRPDDYAQLVASNAVPGSTFHFCTTAESAMRLSLLPSPASGERPVMRMLEALWLINLDLPDASGLDLIIELRHVVPTCKILIVSDHYSETLEGTVRVRCGLPFVCKPTRIEWLTALNPMQQTSRFEISDLK